MVLLASFGSYGIDLKDIKNFSKEMYFDLLLCAKTSPQILNLTFLKIKIVYVLVDAEGNTTLIAIWLNQSNDLNEYLH